LHLSFSVLPLFVIVPEKVKEAVYQKVFYFLIESDTTFGRLSPRLMEVYDDIAEHKFVIRDS